MPMSISALVSRGGVGTTERGSNGDVAVLVLMLVLVLVLVLSSDEAFISYSSLSVLSVPLLSLSVRLPVLVLALVLVVAPEMPLRLSLPSHCVLFCQILVDCRYFVAS